MDRIITNSEPLTGHGNATERQHLIDITDATLAALHPSNLLPAYLDRDRDSLRVDDHEYNLAAIDDVYLIAAGKGAGALAAAAREFLGEDLTEGVIVEKHGQAIPVPGVEVIAAGHPLPDADGLRAATRVLEIADRAGPDDLVVVCITGGASALLPAPAADISIEDLRNLTDQLLASGAPIEEVNAVRKHLSRLKGGRLATRLHPAHVLTLLVVDEVGGAPWGPTIPDATTFSDAIDVLDQYGLWNTTPTSICEYLETGRAGNQPATPTAEQLAAIDHQLLVLADAVDLCQTACSVAEQHGFETLFLSSMIEGESTAIGRCLAGIAKEIAASGNPISPPAVVVSGGETTVTIDEPAGTGGPNQECALGIASAIAEWPNITALVLDTDGTDGPTSIAGALVDASTSERSHTHDLDIREAVSNHASTDVLSALDDAVKTKPTGTNLMDLRLLLISDSEAPQP